MPQRKEPDRQKLNPNQITGIPAAATQGAKEGEQQPHPQPDANVNPRPKVPRQRNRPTPS